MLYGIFIFGFVSLLFFGFFLLINMGKKHLLHLWPARALIAVSLVASAAYLLMALNIGVQEVSGRMVYITRYLDWMITTPLLLFVLLSIGMSRHRLFKRYLVSAIVFDFLMVLFGLLASFHSSFIQSIYFGMSFMFFIFVLVLLTLAWSHVHDQPEEVASLYKSLLFVLLITWFMYPLIWYSHQTLLVDYSSVSEPGLYLFLDFFAKGFFSLLIINESDIFRRSLVR